jgi:endonuclease/exonuclease/phosphatase family metal-dependent hydrolase
MFSHLLRRAKNRHLVLTVLLAIVATLSPVAATSALAAPARPADPSHQRALTVMTYNIHAGAGADNVYDLDRIAGTIEASGAKLIALQEVDRHWSARSNFDDVANLLAQRLGMRSFVAPIYSLDPLQPGQPRREYGVAILSAYPILQTTNHEITRLSTQQSNPVPAPAPGFAEVVVNVRGVHLHAYSTHLDYRSDPSVRVAQVADTLAIMAADSGPKILMGDMNAAPDAPELAPLHAAYSDIWPPSGVGPENTFPAIAPTERIDQILVSPQVTPLAAWVPDSLASDHRPVVAQLLIGR